MQRVTIRIRGYQFSVKAPYSVGDPLGEAETLQLNDLRADNIRNNMTKPVVEEIASLPEHGMLSQGQLLALQAKITAYDNSYQLQLKHQARPRVGQIEAEAKAIAEERLDAQLRAAGMEPGAEEYSRMLGEMVALPSVQALARERVQTKRQVVGGSLEDLL